MKESSIPWQVERLNEGGAMNLTSGIFIVPVNGIYHFEFNGMGNSDYLAISLHVNGNYVASVFDKQSSVSLRLDKMSLAGSLRLKANDKVNMYLKEGSIYDDGGYATRFVGWLVEEDF